MAASPLLYIYTLFCWCIYSCPRAFAESCWRCLFTTCSLSWSVAHMQASNQWTAWASVHGHACGATCSDSVHRCWELRLAEEVARWIGNMMIMGWGGLFSDCLPEQQKGSNRGTSQDTVTRSRCFGSCRLQRIRWPLLRRSPRHEWRRRARRTSLLVDWATESIEWWAAEAANIKIYDIATAIPELFPTHSDTSTQLYSLFG